MRTSACGNRGLALRTQLPYMYVTCAEYVCVVFGSAVRAGQVVASKQVLCPRHPTLSQSLEEEPALSAKASTAYYSKLRRRLSAALKRKMTRFRMGIGADAKAVHIGRDSSSVPAESTAIDGFHFGYPLRGVNGSKLRLVGQH